jgi:hypothetical protein
MRDIAYARVEKSLPMPGVFEVSEGLPLAPVIEELILIDGASDPEEWSDAVRYLPLR